MTDVWTRRSALRKFANFCVQHEIASEVPWTLQVPVHERARQASPVSTSFHDPLDLINFLEASSFLRDLNDTRLASAAFVKALFRQRAPRLMKDSAAIPARPSAFGISTP